MFRKGILVGIPTQDIDKYATAEYTNISFWSFDDDDDDDDYTEKRDQNDSM